MLRDSAYKLSRCRHLTHIYDERHVLRPRLAWCQFLQDRITHSDFDGIALGQRTKLISAEYNALSEDEKKVCLSSGTSSSILQHITTQHTLTTVYRSTKIAQLPTRRATAARWPNMTPRATAVAQSEVSFLAVSSLVSHLGLSLIVRLDVAGLASALVSLARRDGRAGRNWGMEEGSNEGVELIPVAVV
jgi:hypothetical protein